jgi:TonB family protein
MSSPRFRDGSVNGFPFADVERGKEGTMLTLASIDQNGTVRAIEVIYRSGDEGTLTRTLQAVRDTGFEPARLGNRTVPVNFLYFTTTEVRAAARLSTQDGPTPSTHHRLGLGEMGYFYPYLLYLPSFLHQLSTKVRARGHGVQDVRDLHHQRIGPPSRYPDKIKSKLSCLESAMPSVRNTMVHFPELTAYSMLWMALMSSSAAKTTR